MAGKIFINYRRGDDAGFTGRLFDFLERSFATDQLFIDVDNIPAGADFTQVLEAQVAQCDVMLSVIGRGWLDARDEHGNRRLDQAADFVSIEIETALKLGKRVIPVLVNGADMPRPEILPVPLRPLSRRNAVRLTHERFRMDAQGLVHSVEAALRDVEAAAKAARDAALVEAQRMAQRMAQQASADAAIAARLATPGTAASEVPNVRDARDRASSAGGVPETTAELDAQAQLVNVQPVAVAPLPAGMIRGPKDFATGCLFLLLGAISYGITPEFGSVANATTIKFLPRLLALMVLAFGGLSLVRAFVVRGPSFGAFGWTPLLLLPACCIVSALALPYIGMPLALTIIGVACAFAAPSVRFDWQGFIGYAVAVTIAFVFCTAVLKVNFPLTGSVLQLLK